MPKSPFLVLGSASTIFFTLLTLSLLCAQSVDGSIDLVWSQKIVTVQNDIDPSVAFKIHCKSSEDDLDERILYYKQSFYWRFKVNFMRSTKFICDSSWYDPNEKKNHTMEFFAYKTRRDYDRHCLGDCFWSIRRDGGYYGNSGADKDFPFEKMFSYE
ncbi:S-protein homolog 29-like [Papaver somniferum]|uniref:S-protein homolog 29-like n=1 Tax=Papaver somniferum TaxID=3469 RepID=UPI000E6FF5A7|nr:S-protein homolog 29-like [Papaver somniferum]XP_026415895.1 S-protein homolog 29-like [Papaver somniferum]